MTVSKQPPGSPLAVTSNTVCDVCSPDWYWHHTKMTVICTTCYAVLHKGGSVCRCAFVFQRLCLGILVNVSLKDVYYCKTHLSLVVYWHSRILSTVSTHLSSPGVSCPWVSQHCVGLGARAACGQRAPCLLGWVCARVLAWPAGLRLNPESDPE